MKETIIFGTYSARDSKGIYEADFDTDSQKLEFPHLSVKIGAPTYLALSNGQNIYAVDQEDSMGGVAVFDYSTNNIEEIEKHLFHNSSPVNITINEKYKLVFASNYNNGFVQIFKIQKNGDIKLVDEIHNMGHGILPQQSNSHVHYAQISPDGKLCIADLGTDEILIFSINKNGRVISKISTFCTRQGFGPKKITFLRDGIHAYVLGELASQIGLLIYNPSTETFAQTQIVSTIPDNWVGQNGCGGMHLTHDEKYLYVSNRGHNSISVYQVNASDQTLKMVQNVPSEGCCPREFCLDQSEKFLFVGNQKSDNVTIFSRDSTNGTLTLVSKDNFIPEPVCLLCTQ